jgi:predicted Holliday junction resolvase-like endonuclease
MFEGICILVVACLIYFIFNQPKQDDTIIDELRNENEFLKNRLNAHDAKNQERESNLNQTIQKLQYALNKNQNSNQEFNKDYKQKEIKLNNKIEDLEKKLDDETQARKKVLSQKKSGEVRLGHIAETLAPFLDQFEFEPERCSFLGQPIDYISFGEDEITFIEVKSGNSQLSQKQRQIRDLVKQKSVSWKEVRIK